MTDIPAEVVRMVLAGDQRRADRATTALNTLTRYERRLVREAAVMGYVLGRRDGQISRPAPGTGMPDDRFPRDAHILQDVIEHCDSTSDLYPYLAAACAGRRRRVTRARMWPGEVSAQ